MCQSWLCALQSIARSVWQGAGHEKCAPFEIHRYYGKRYRPAQAKGLSAAVVEDEVLNCKKTISDVAREAAVFVQVSNVEFERQPIADHASQLAAGIQQNLKRSLEGLGVVRHPLECIC